jgi:hypothetical protein
VSRAPRRPVALTDRDRQILHAAWSLGYAPASTLHALISPTVAPGTFRHRLRRLHQNSFLVQQRFIAPASGLWLYGLGRASLHPGDKNPWRPGLTQLAHTLDVGAAVVALTRPGFAAPRVVTGWRGEAEIRGWAPPGAPYPDAAITWTHGGTAGSWLVELDRATEARAAWRRKLVRYLTTPPPGLVLVLTTSEVRASNLAREAAEVGVPLLATTLRACQQTLDPVVLDTRTKRRVPLSQT